MQVTRVITTAARLAVDNGHQLHLLVLRRYVMCTEALGLMLEDPGHFDPPAPTTLPLQPTSVRLQPENKIASVWLGDTLGDPDTVGVVVADRCPRLPQSLRWLRAMTGDLAYDLEHGEFGSAIITVSDA